MKVRIIRKPEYDYVHHVQRKFLGFFWCTVFYGTLDTCEKVVENFKKYGVWSIVVKEYDV
jgi:hypothetical protein